MVHAELASMLPPGGKDVIQNPSWETEAVFKSRWRGRLVAMAIWNARFHVNKLVTVESHTRDVVVNHEAIGSRHHECYHNHLFIMSVVCPHHGLMLFQC